MIKKIVFASHNQGKIKEMRELLEPFGVEVVSAAELNLGDIEETGTTFEENAKLKAYAVMKQTGLPALADDSGLCVDALDGRPGVYSARYAPNRDFAKAMDLLLAEMNGVQEKDRGAHFSCFLVIAYPDETCRVFEGRVDGKIALKKSGTGGFGFDPIFIPDGYDISFGQFSAEEKNKISHRGRALAKFVAEVF